MDFFFSCDWGTSAFRLRLIDTGNLKIVAEVKTGNGIALTFDSWKKLIENQKSRLAFYQDYIFEQLNTIAGPFINVLNGAPVILSGMASSSIGMVELPYKEVPFQCNGSDLMTHLIPASQAYPYKMVIISGARSDADVIRGEETMVAGCGIMNEDKERLFIFPGTHSKHLVVKNGKVTDITTYMTGELFDLLSNKSILSASVEKSEPQFNNDTGFFEKGVLKGAMSNLANNIFHVRTNQLFKKAGPAENYQYLSGLLIGNELKDIVADKPAAITLVCGEGLAKVYIKALNILQLDTGLDYKNADVALIKGQWEIIKLMDNEFNL